MKLFIIATLLAFSAVATQAQARGPIDRDPVSQDAAEKPLPCGKLPSGENNLARNHGALVDRSGTSSTVAKPVRH